MATATITSKGQTTIPKSIRDDLGLKAGSRIEFVQEPNGTVRLIPLNISAMALKGFLPKPEKPVSIEEMNEAVRKHVAAKYLALNNDQ